MGSRLDVRTSGLIDETIQLVEATGDTSFLPELLRLKAGLLLSMPRSDPTDAKYFFRRSN
jgi:hypothetical protein